MGKSQYALTPGASLRRPCPADGACQAWNGGVKVQDAGGDAAPGLRSRKSGTLSRSETMFGIGMGEMLLIMVIAVVVIGPKQLPEVARTVGKVFAQFKRTSNELREQVNKEVSEFTEMEDVKEFKHSMESELFNVRSTAEQYVQSEMDKLDQEEHEREAADKGAPESGSVSAPETAVAAEGGSAHGGNGQGAGAAEGLAPGIHGEPTEKLPS